LEYPFLDRHASSVRLVYLYAAIAIYADFKRLSQSKIYVLGMLITLNLRATPPVSSDAGTTGGINISFTMDAVTKTVSYHRASQSGGLAGR
jgi:hypothetical protein